MAQDPKTEHNPKCPFQFKVTYTNNIDTFIKEMWTGKVKPSIAQREEMEWMLAQVPADQKWTRVSHATTSKYACCWAKQRKAWKEWEGLIFIRGGVDSWVKIFHMAHEIGHAMDVYGTHPAQKVLGKNYMSQNRYRAESAACSYAIAVTEKRNWQERSLNDPELLRWYKGNFKYVASYVKAAKNADFMDVLQELRSVIPAYKGQTKIKAAKPKAAKKTAAKKTITERQMDMVIKLVRVGAPEKTITEKLKLGNGVLRMWRSRKPEFKKQWDEAAAHYQTVLNYRMKTIMTGYKV